MADEHYTEVEVDKKAADDVSVDDAATFTQKQLSDAMTATKAKAERAAKKKAKEELLAEYGMTPEEVQAIRKEREKAEADEMSALEKTEKELAEALQRADELEALRAWDQLEREAERRLMKAGVDEKALARMVKMLELQPDADDDALDEAIAALREELPQLFTDEEPEDSEPVGRSGVSGRGVTPPKNPAPVKSGIAAGRDRFTTKAAERGPTPLERFQGKR